MSRNFSRDYVKKLLKTEAPNGYKFDVANYLHNPSFDHNYPSFHKKLDEHDGLATYRSIHYFKLYSGGGYYEEHVYDVPLKTENGNSWVISKNMRTKTLEYVDRFNLKKMLTFC